MQSQPGRIPGSLLASAKSLNNFNGLVRVASLITPQNYTLQILQVFLHHLRPELLTLPPHIEGTQAGTDLADLRLRFACFSGAQAICVIAGAYSSIASGASVREATIDKLMEHLEDIIAWYRHILSTPTRVLQSHPSNVGTKDPIAICLALKALMSMDQRLKRAVLSSYSVIEVFFAAWAVRDARGLPCLSFSWSAHGCPIVEVFLAFARFDASRQKIFDLLCDQSQHCKVLRNQVVDGLVSRLELVTQLDESSIIAQQKSGVSSLGISRNLEPPIEIAIFSISRIFAVADEMCRNPMLLVEILGSKFPEAVCRALELWLVQRTDRNLAKHRQDRKTGFVAAVLMLKLVNEEGSTQNRRCLHALRGMIKGGIVSIIAEALRSIPEKSEDWSLPFSMLDSLKSNCVYPSLVADLSEAFIKFRGDDYSNIDFLRVTGNEGYWELFCMDVALAASTMLKYGQSVDICDNLKCEPGRKTFAPSKECSGCHAVVYCSEACQQEDWTEQHRNECHLARIDYKDLSSNKMHFPHGLRSFHAHLILRRADQVLKVWEESLPEDLTVTPAVLILRGWSSPRFQFDTYPYFHMGNRLQEHHAMKTRAGGSVSSKDTLDPPRAHYFDQRVYRLMYEFAKDGGAQRGIRLVESIQTFGDKEVFTMAKLQLQSPEPNEPFELVSSVTRIVPRIAPQDLRPPQRPEE